VVGPYETQETAEKAAELLAEKVAYEFGALADLELTDEVQFAPPQMNGRAIH
jgi:hypothetical protein